MARIIVEEAGGSRSYRAGDGVLTVGTGEDARLRLSSADVASLHAELELRGERLTLKTYPGVVAPRLAGVEVQGEVEVSFGQSIVIGSAVLRVEADPEEATLVPEEAPPARPVPNPAGPNPAAPRRAQRTPGAGSPSRAAKGRGRPVKAPRADGQRPSRRERERGENEEARSPYSGPRARSSAGIPTGAAVGLILGGVLIGGYILLRLFQSGSSVGVKPETLIDLAAENWNKGDLGLVQHYVERVTPAGEESLGSAYRQQLAELRSGLNSATLSARQGIINNVGTKHLDVWLKRYETNHLQGSPGDHKVRLFLKRCRYFRERWPNHPEIDWVDRQEALFSERVSLDTAPTWADVEWEVRKTCPQKGEPKNFKSALALLEEFASSAGSSDAALARARIAELLVFRKEQFDYEMGAARDYFERKEDWTSGSQVLIDLVLYIGEPEMEAAAATAFVNMERIQSTVIEEDGSERIEPTRTHLGSYKHYNPYRFEALTANSKLRAFAEEAGLL